MRLTVGPSMGSPGGQRPALISSTQLQERVATADGPATPTGAVTRESQPSAASREPPANSLTPKSGRERRIRVPLNLGVMSEAERMQLYICSARTRF